LRFNFKYALAGNPDTAEKLLRRLAAVNDVQVRCRLAENHNTPQDVLKRLSCDSHPDVRAALAFNKAVSQEILEKLCSDEDVNVRMALAEGTELPESVLRILSEDVNPYVSNCAERTLQLIEMEARLKADNLDLHPKEDARLGTLLRKSGWLDEKHLNRLLSMAENQKRPLGQIILKETDLPHDILVAALKAQAAIQRGQIAVADAIKILRQKCREKRHHNCRERRSTKCGSTMTAPASEAYASEKELALSSNPAKTKKDTAIPSRILQTCQYQIAQVLADSESLTDAATGLLHAICKAANWEAGVLWEVDRHYNRLYRLDGWQVCASSYCSSKLLCEDKSFEPGLPAEAWKSGKWIRSFGESTTTRHTAGHAGDTMFSVAFPIHTKEQVAAVLEFFYSKFSNFDEGLTVLEAAAHQIGLFIEQKEAQNRLREFHAIIADIGSALVRTATMKELLQNCAQAIVTHLDASFARIWTLDETSHHLILQASAGLYTHVNGAHQRISVGEFKIGLIASEQKPHLTNDVQNDPRVSNKEWAKKEGIVAFAGYPLIVGGKLVGVMAMFAQHPLAQDTIEALGSIADHVALGIERKQNEDSLRKLASMVASCNDAIIGTDLDGIITHCNDAAEQLCGYSIPEFLGKPISLLFVDDVFNQHLFDIEKLNRGENLKHHETTIARRDGTLVEVSLTLSSIRDSAGEMTGVAIIARDISRRRRDEKMLSVQYKAARILAESTSLSDAVPKLLETISKSFQWCWSALWIADQFKNELRCSFVWNEGREDLNELTSISQHMTFTAGVGTVGQTYSESHFYWTPDFSTSNKYPRAGIAQKAGMHTSLTFPIVLGDRVLAVFEFANRQIDEPDNPMLDMMSSLGVLLAQFIERKSAEEKARLAMQAEQRIAQAIIHLAPASIARLDRNLAINSMNKQFGEQFASSITGPDEILEKFIFQILPDLPNERLIYAVEKKIPFSLNNYGMRSISGTEVKHWDLAGWPVESDDGGMIIMATDVTDRVKLTQQRDDFVATLTHDLKNPLIGSIRILDFLLDGKAGVLDENQLSLLKTMSSSNQHMLNLISHLLEIHRYDSGRDQLHYASLDIQTLVEESVQHFLAASTDSKVEVKVFFFQDDNKIMADSLAIRRVIENLLSNAIKFTGENGEIIVSGETRGETYVLEIRDNGSGICPEEKARMFERYSQGEHGRKHKLGTGLGLYLCRQIIERHCGEISCTSEVGRGTTFTVSLPMHP